MIELVDDRHKVFTVPTSCLEASLKLVELQESGIQVVEKGQASSVEEEHTRITNKLYVREIGLPTV